MMVGDVTAKVPLRAPPDDVTGSPGGHKVHRAARDGTDLRTSAMLRLKVLQAHLSGSGGGLGGAHGPDDVVVVHGVRTAITKAKRGAFKVTPPGGAGPLGLVYWTLVT